MNLDNLIHKNIFSSMKLIFLLDDVLNKILKSSKSDLIDLNLFLQRNNIYTKKVLRYGNLIFV